MGGEAGGGGAPGGAGGVGGSSGSAGSGGATLTECPKNLTAFTATRITAPVSWDGEGLEDGSGEAKFWNVAELTFDGTTTVQAKIKPCGTALPPTDKKIGVDYKVQLDMPVEQFDDPSMPTFDVTGTLADFTPNAAINMDPALIVIGTTMMDPVNDPWPKPAQRDNLPSDDHGADGFPGVSLFPLQATGYGNPPVALGGAGNADKPNLKAIQVGVASRLEFKLSGNRQNCLGAAGTAEVIRVESAIVACERPDGMCTKAQVNFMNVHAPNYVFGDGSYEMKLVSSLSCAEARMALP